MKDYKATLVDYRIACQQHNINEVFPLVRDEKGQYTIYNVSPIHGRSFVLKREENNKWIIGKGNGLAFTTHPFVLTSTVCGETWGGLSLSNAIRDYKIGNEIRELGIKTNHMHCVLELDKKIIKNGEEKHAALLQYSVNCPYRISDWGFMPSSFFKKHILKWGNEFPKKHLYAADVLVCNLRILHDNNIMHNAINTQNYTWDLELVDFEASRSDNYPYDNPEYEAHVPMLIEMEVIQTYEIINYIAWCLSEDPNYKEIEEVFKKYGFKLREHKL